jgi:plastocyanin
MKKFRYLLISLLIVVFAATLTGCSATTTVKNTVNIQGSQFSPTEITIKKGDTVTWINKDSVGHTVIGATFQSSLLDTGQSFKQTFNEVGTFEYHCSVHPSMVGKVIVTSSAY